MDLPRLFVVTGVMAAGKSSVAQALAERFPRSVHVRGDTFRRFVVNGYAAMAPDPSTEAVRDLRLRYRLAALVADDYVAAGFVTVVQDIMVGAELSRFVAMLATRPVGLVVLTPSPEVITAREAQRAKTGYTTFTPTALDADLRTSTERIGLWIDNSALTIDETVDAILANRAASLVH
jgi:chloramphenicol 3-O-phosphotransferase